VCVCVCVCGTRPRVAYVVECPVSFARSFIVASNVASCTSRSQPAPVEQGAVSAPHHTGMQARATYQLTNPWPPQRCCRSCACPQAGPGSGPPCLVAVFTHGPRMIELKQNQGNEKGGKWRGEYEAVRVRNDAAVGQGDAPALGQLPDLWSFCSQRGGSRRVERTLFRWFLRLFAHQTSNRPQRQTLATRLEPELD